MIDRLREWLQRARTPQSRMQMLVGLTLVLASAFGLTAWRTARTERHKVTMTTCYFAADAARILQSRSWLYLESAAGPIFAAVGGRAALSAGAALPSPLALKQADLALARCHCAPRLSVRSYFRLDMLADGKAGALVLAAADSTGATASGSGPLHGVLPLDTTRIKEAVGRATEQFRDGGVVAAAVTSSNTDNDTLRAVAVVSPKFDVNGKLAAVYGLIIAPQDFATDVVVPVFDRVPLFPRYLAATTLGYRAWVWGPETHNRELANLAILDAGYRPLYQTGPMADTAEAAPGCVGITMREPALASLTVELSPPLEVSTRWINISMATSQLPFLGATMIGMLVCVGAAALAARREVELARLRSDFVSSISHELRMPLAQILLSGETLSLGRTRSQAERDEAADAIVREAHRLTGLVDNALFFSRVEHHNVHVLPKPAEVLPIANEAAAGVAPLAQGVKASITITIPAGFGALVDRDAFRQVLYNLLENAVKYGPPGQEIIVGGEPAPSDPGRAQIWVDDQGPGIPRGKESVIFEPFVRLPRDRDLRVAGSGLGLAVVRYILMRHGGEITVDRGRRGTGSRFVITVPRATVPNENPGTAHNDQRTEGPPFHDAAD